MRENPGFERNRVIALRAFDEPVTGNRAACFETYADTATQVVWLDDVIADTDVIT